MSTPQRYGTIPVTGVANACTPKTERNSNLSFPSEPSSHQNNNNPNNTLLTPTNRDLESASTREVDDKYRDCLSSICDYVFGIVGFIILAVVLFFGLAVIIGLIGAVATLSWTFIPPFLALVFHLIGATLAFFGDCVGRVYHCIVHVFGL